jgi:hypothetical protein
MDDAAVIQKAIKILEGPDAEKILRASMSDLEPLIDLGVLEVDVEFTLQRLKDAPKEIQTADDIARQFGSYCVARDIVKIVEEQA